MGHLSKRDIEFQSPELLRRPPDSLSSIAHTSASAATSLSRDSLARQAELDHRVPLHLPTIGAVLALGLALAWIWQAQRPGGIAVLAYSTMLTVLSLLLSVTGGARSVRWSHWPGELRLWWRDGPGSDRGETALESASPRRSSRKTPADFRVQRAAGTSPQAGAASSDWKKRP